MKAQGGAWFDLGRSLGALATVALLAFSSALQAQEVIPDFYREPGLNPNRSYVNQNFSEHIDPFNGSLQLHYTDVRLPGNGGFDIQVSRSYNSAAVIESNPNAYYGSAGVGWTVHFGRVLFKATTGACGGTSFPNTLNDPVLELPDGSTQLLVATGGTPTLLSTQRWRADCTTSPPGITVFSPDGVRYDMTQQVGLPSGPTALSAWYTTKITDRNGNYANIVYTGSASPEVSSVQANDGRRIDFTYLAQAGGELTRRINSVTSRDSQGDRVYMYGYQAIVGFAGAYNLTSVTRPGGTQWQYQYFGDRNATIPGGFLLSAATYPEGGTISYGYGTSLSDYVYFDTVSNAQSRTTVIKSKSTGDGGTWSFSYSPGAAGTYDTTTVNTPSGAVTYRHVGPNFASSGTLWMVGLLMQKVIGSAQSETYSWASQVISSQQLKRPGAWLATRFDNNTSAPVMASKSIARDGASHYTTFSVFDGYGNPTSISETGPNGGSRSTSLSYYYDTSKWIVKQVRNQNVSGGVQITRNFDGNGNLYDITQDGVTTTFPLRFSHGEVNQATFPRGLVHTYSNYKGGIAQAESQPEGISLSRSVSDSGNVVSETNGRGYTTTYAYDGLNRLTRITPPQGGVTNISYGQASKSATRGGTLTENTSYDGFGRPFSVTLGGITRTYGHDVLGRTTFVSDPGVGAGTGFQYDILDRVTYVTNADGTNRAFAFGAGSKTLRDERNYSTTYVFRTYGDPGQQFLMSISAPDSAANVMLGRDGRDLVTSIYQAGLTRTYGYDGRGFLTSVVNPETGTTTYGRDDAENMTSRTVGSSGATNFGYDGQNRLISAGYPGGTPSVTKSYTGTHRLNSVTTSIATRSFDYDANDNLTGETLIVDGLSFGLAYGYTGNDQLSSLIYPRSGRVVSYAPDALGRPTQVSGFVNSLVYWPSGQIYQIVYANNTTSTYGQNNRLWPSYFQAAKGATSYVNSSYYYDGLGNLTSIADSVDSSYNRGLGYDPLNRLTSASGPWGSGTLAYNGTGNLLSQTFGSSTLSYSYSSNRLSSVSGSRTASYSYDAYGDVVGNGPKTFGYDGAPNMTCANCNDAATRVDYQYDGLNQRVSSLKAGVKTYEFYGFNGNLLTELTPSLSNRLSEYIYLGGKRIATVGSAPTTISLPAQSLTAIAGQAVTFTAALSGGASPTGTISFFDGSTLLGTFAVASGQASLTTTFTVVGSHTLTAVYSGNATNFGSSTSATVNVLSSTTIAGPAGGPGLTAYGGKPTVLAATVNGSSPTGSISFYDGSKLLGTAPLINGTASLTVTILIIGSHTIKFVYSGDAHNAPSSATVTLNVQLAPEKLIPILQLLLD